MRRITWETFTGATQPDVRFFSVERPSLNALATVTVAFALLSFADAGGKGTFTFLVRIAVGGALLLFLRTGSRFAWWLMFLYWLLALVIDGLVAVHGTALPWTAVGAGLAAAALFVLTGIWRPTARPIT